MLEVDIRVKFQWVKLEFSFIDNFKIYETWIFFAYNVKKKILKNILKYFLKNLLRHNY
jgi:hypothetical protein